MIEKICKAKLLEESYKLKRKIASVNYYNSKKNDQQYKQKKKAYQDKKYKISKELLSDSYIKKILKVYKDATPEMIENKRNEILEFRKMKLQARLQKQILIDIKSKSIENMKLNGIIKLCKNHGELKKDDVFFVKNGKSSLNKIHKCKHCVHEISKKTYFRNKDKIRIKQKTYCLNNPNKNKIRSKKWVERLSNAYVARYFTKSMNINRKDVSQDLINTKRSLMLLTRKIKEQKK